MEFNIGERLAALGLLPQEGTLITMKIVHDLRQALAFDEAELAVLDFQQSDGQLRWNNSTKRNTIVISNAAIAERQTLTVEIVPNGEGIDEEILIFGPKEVKVGVKAAGIIHDELGKLDKDGALRESHLALCEKFEYEG